MQYCEAAWCIKQHIRSARLRLLLGTYALVEGLPPLVRGQAADACRMLELYDSYLALLARSLALERF